VTRRARPPFAVCDPDFVRIDIVVYDGLDEMDALGPLEVLRSATAAGADITARLVARLPAEEVTGAFGLRFRPDGAYEPGADILIVPGGGWAARAERGAWAEVQEGSWLPLLADAARQVRVMAGVCTGTMLLAHAGVVGSRRASTHHTALGDLAATGAQVVSERVVDDGNLVTSGGVTAGIDLALWIVERFTDRALADRLAQRMEYQTPPPNRNAVSMHHQLQGFGVGGHGLAAVADVRSGIGHRRTATRGCRRAEMGRWQRPGPP